jgi:hypothetical protein
VSLNRHKEIAKRGTNNGDNPDYVAQEISYGHDAPQCADADKDDYSQQPPRTEDKITAIVREDRAMEQIGEQAFERQKRSLQFVEKDRPFLQVLPCHNQKSAMYREQQFIRKADVMCRSSSILHL